jgi:uncharacterized protein
VSDAVWPGDGSPYHAGEIAAQERAGTRVVSERMGRKMIRDHMPDQHRELFATLPYLVVGTLDARGQPWASMLVGPPGFVASPDEHTLAIRAAPLPEDPAAANIAAGAPIGVLGIELHTRRRNRANGTVVAVDGDTLHVLVEQSFGNCPQYIQARAPVDVVAPTAPRGHRSEGPHLSPGAAAIVRAADTFFIATAAGATAGDPRRGVDVSHRGGRPGFVRVSDTGPATTLTIPDFSGNNAFNTIGNLGLEPRAGLLFLDFATGDVVTITGTVEVVWDGPELARFAGAERLLRVAVTGGAWIPSAVPLRWSPAQQARQLAGLGSWD